MHERHRVTVNVSTLSRTRISRNENCHPRSLRAHDGLFLCGLQAEQDLDIDHRDDDPMENLNLQHLDCREVQGRMAVQPAGFCLVLV